MTRLIGADDTTRRAVVVGTLAVLLLMALPDAVAACPVCFSATDENRLAFLGTTVALSLLPLGMVASAGLWIRTKVKNHGDEPDDPDSPET
jgi:hypothetical protein